MTLLERNGHGGDLQTASELFKRSPQEFLDYSANINPLGPPKEVIELLHSNIHSIQHYPDPNHRLLKKKLGEKFDVDTSTLMVGNGAAECMAATFLGLRPNQIGLIHPCFSEYEALARSFGIPVISCIGEKNNNYKPLKRDLFRVIKNSDLVCVGHPNNPTGEMYSMEELMEMAEYGLEHDTFLLMDEAFIDFIPRSEQNSLVSQLEVFPNIIIVRSMTKFYAIPGLRLGFIIANQKVISKISAVQTTWSVNQLALIAGEACLDQGYYENQTIALIKKEREYLKSRLEELRFSVIDGKANFLLVHSNQKTVQELQLKLGEKGILIRSCAMYTGLSEFDFRVAIRNRDENDIFLSAIKTI